MARPRPLVPRCVVCNRVAEVSHPDGYGDQTHYCAEHEPPTLLTELMEGSEDDGSQGA